MKTLGITLLWVAAFFVAVWLLVRARRGRPVVLKGRWAPRFARMVVVLLLALGVSTPSTSADDPEGKQAKEDQPAADDPLPNVLSATVVNAMRSYEEQRGRFVKAYTIWRLGQGPGPRAIGGGALLPPFVALVHKELQAGNNALPAMRASELIATLREVEERGFIGHFTVGFFWRWSAAVPAPANAQEQAQLVTLFEALHRHARLANAFIKARAEVKPMVLAPRAWMSKAGPKREDVMRERKIQKDLLAAARKHYPEANAAPWSTEGGVTLRIAAGPAATIHRGRAHSAAAAGQSTHIGRLDLIDSRGTKGLLLEHAWIGPIALPGERLFSVWDLTRHLSPGTQKRIEVVVTAALLGDADAATKLETALPLAHQALATALTERPDAKGAPRLRMLLHQFTD